VLFAQNHSARSRLMPDLLAQAGLRWQRKVVNVL
jgi:hypothetical protein